MYVCVRGSVAISCFHAGKGKRLLTCGQADLLGRGDTVPLKFSGELRVACQTCPDFLNGRDTHRVHQATEEFLLLRPDLLQSVNQESIVHLKHGLGVHTQRHVNQVTLA